MATMYKSSEKLHNLRVCQPSFATLTAATIVIVVLVGVGKGHTANTGLAQTRADDAQVSLDQDEVVLSRHHHRFSVLGQELVRTKILNTSTLQLREVVVDAATGIESSYDDTEAAEKRARRVARGAADAVLLAKLATARPDEKVRVALRPFPGKSLDVRAALARIGAVLEEEHHGILYATAWAAAWDGVLDLPALQDMTHAPRPTVLALGMGKDLGQASIAQAHQLGVGTGFIAAVWEPESCVHRKHPDFRSATWLPRPGGTLCDPRGGNYGGDFGHSTKVASALAGDRGTDGTVGIYRARLIDIDAVSSKAVDAMWALNPQIVNASYTVGVLEGERVDREVYARKSFVFIAAGNSPTWTAGCGGAYNALCVGGYLGVGGLFSDDRPVGSYLNDQRSGRESPQVVGPWNARKLANWGLDGYEAAQGTSYAAPAVAGTAGLLLATHPFALWERPALMRAVLMASAQAHPVADPQGKRIPDFNDAYDDRVGVGAPNGGRANRILTNQTYFFSSSFEPTDLGPVASISTPANYRLRVVMSWDQCPGGDILNPGLNADFDMVIAGPAVSPYVRREYHSNLSDVDNYEVIEVVPQLTTTYTVNVAAPRWSVCAAEGGRQRARLALAWTLEPTSAGTVGQ